MESAALLSEAEAASADALRTENAALRAEVDRLSAALQEASASAREGGGGDVAAAPLDGHAEVHAVHGDAELAHGALPGPDPGAAAACAAPPSFLPAHGLSSEQVHRYSRQLLLPSFGLCAQQGLCSAKVLIIGCGGLGSPAALYLAAAGVGTLGLADNDVVELSNLHRQIIHTEGRVGLHKVASAAAAVGSINSSVHVVRHLGGLSAANALDIVQGYDVVLDCSDNPPTRYLVSDACVAAGKPLVSAAAVGTDGQLTVYHHGEDGPCYRCLFPEAPAPENCSRCSDAGVLGVVPGVMGALQALEAIKIVSGRGAVMSRRMLIFDALAGKFMAVNIRRRNPSCIACGDTPSLDASALGAYNYVKFTGMEANDSGPTPLQVIPESERMTPQQAKVALDDADARCVPAVVLDVRPTMQFHLMHLPGALNVPEEELSERLGEVVSLCGRGADSNTDMRGKSGGACTSTGPDAASASASEAAAGGGVVPLLVICRRGNASQLAVQTLRAAGLSHAVDIIGGMQRWAADVDPSMPVL